MHGLDGESLKVSAKFLTNLNKTSEASKSYNCIAWAAGDSARFWWPIGGFWPSNVSRKLVIDSFIDAFATLGYMECGNGDLESGYEKVAIYEKNCVPKHAARQLPNANWTSKLGRNIDIEHTLEELDKIQYISDRYGQVTRFMKRKI